VIDTLLIIVALAVVGIPVSGLIWAACIVIDQIGRREDAA
jgi:hypothetical protein